MKGSVAVVIVLALTGCWHQRGSITLPNATVTGPKDGNSATVASNEKHETIPIPANSTVTVTEKPAVPATQTTPYIPAQKITEIKFSGPTEWQKFDTSLSANTGTIDTTVATKRIDSEESRPLLYAAILSALAAGFFLYRAYPTPAYICGGAAVVFALAWKLAGLPTWFWAIGACGLAGAAFLYLGHERGLNTTPNPP